MSDIIKEIYDLIYPSHRSALSGIPTPENCSIVYLSSILQQLVIAETQAIPTAGVGFSPVSHKLQLLINKSFWDALPHYDKLVLIWHELRHITNLHILEKPTRELNIKMDKSINQLPMIDRSKCDIIGKLGVFPLPTEQLNKEWQYYSAETESGEGGYDDHSDFGNVDKTEGAKAIKKVMRRALEKVKGYSTELSREIEKTISNIDTYLRGVDYYAILKRAIKKSIPTITEKSTWERPSRRYGFQAQGTTSDSAPKVSVYCDTSGSITEEEIRTQLAFIHGLTKHANAEISVHLFHTSVYYSTKFNKGKNAELKLEMGGTDLTDVFNHIYKTKNDLIIVLTDGQYGEVANVRIKQPVIFLLTANGEETQPIKHRLISEIKLQRGE